MSHNARKFFMMMADDGVIEPDETTPIINLNSTHLWGSNSSWNTLKTTTLATATGSPIWAQSYKSGSTFYIFRGMFAISAPLSPVVRCDIKLIKHPTLPGVTPEDSYLYLFTQNGSVGLGDFLSVGVQISDRTSSDASGTTYQLNAAGLALLNDGRSELRIMVRNYRDAEDLSEPTITTTSYRHAITGSTVDMYY